jgi:3-oxoacyl-[acyl-carrier protein] reductase
LLRLANKTAVITGGTSQFGHVIAKAYVNEGADVYLQEWPENKEQLDALVAELQTPGRRISGATYEVNTTAGATQLAADAMKAFGKIDILVNTTAGGGHGPFFEMKESAFRRTLDRGITSYFLVTQAVGKEMARKGYGKVINISSVVGRIGSGGAVGWGADRGGIDSMTAAIAQAIGPYGINVTALARGATDTTAYTQAAIDERKRRLPFGRLGKEEDIIGPAVFLATDDAGWITGSIIYADGGYVTAAATDEADRPTEVPYRGA